ncbi:hypothetical protein KR038_000006 [Drosophila bunnanda]|nr:hypothetical protein KR038_000006 [Drosophila bunnanda]
MKIPKLPDWVSGLSLGQAVQSYVDSGDSIVTVLPNVHLIEYRNCTVLLPIQVKIQLRDNTVRRLSFLLKAQHGNDFQAKIMGQLKMFVREHYVYHNILPRFEELFQAAGQKVSFGPRAFKLDRSIGVRYILMENLKVRGYYNVERSQGFDSEYLKQVLRKLAQFHAASAVYVEKRGEFKKLLTNGIYTKANQEILRELNNPEVFLSQLRRLRIGDHFHKQLVDKEEVLVKKLLELHAPDSQQFNVLNHCDCWANNVMFKHDDLGNVVDTALLDFQVVKYGSPVGYIFFLVSIYEYYFYVQANDLYYTILSSAEKDIKLTEFDNMVQYYFYHLMDNLKVLAYGKDLPKLEYIRESLTKHGLAAYVVVTRVLPITMMNQFEDEVNERYASKMKCSMFTNRKYIQAMKEILPWMEQRSLLNWE